MKNRRGNVEARFILVIKMERMNSAFKISSNSRFNVTNEETFLYSIYFVLPIYSKSMSITFRVVS